MLPDVDALLTRTTTKVNPVSFPEFPARLKAIASATAGTDHIDQEWTRMHGLTFTHSPGCNARSVAEYVATVLIHACEANIEQMRNQKVGIIGYGHTGSQVAELLTRLGISYLAYDPPLQQQNPAFRSAPLEQVLDCDILSLHVPLTTEGEWPTFNMLNSEVFEGRSYDIIINASRGGVLNEQDAIALKQNNRLRFLALDVWENEPRINPNSLMAADIATPHIAGYSLQAKYRASRIACEGLGRALGFKVNTRQPDWGNSSDINASAGLYSTLRYLHPLFDLDELLREQPDRFATLRNTHPLRMEFEYTNLKNTLYKGIQIFGALRFNIIQ